MGDALRLYEFGFALADLNPRDLRISTVFITLEKKSS